MKKMKIKVCGLKEESNIKAIGKLDIDLMGFIFHSPSPRYCGNEIGPFTLSMLPKEIEAVAVTVNLDEAEIMHISSRFGFKIFQLHGEESPELCETLKNAGLTVIKSFSIKESADFKKTAAYKDKAHYFLFDTATAQHGGSGRKFDWNLLDHYNGETPFFLSGGISAEDAEAILRLDHPMLEGIDLNSRFELSPAIKDSERIKDFVAAIKSEEEKTSERPANRLSKLLESDKENLLAVYFTAGFPRLESTGEIIDALCEGKVDIIEVGIPFSDPMADGVVIQHSSSVALQNGMTLPVLMDQVKEARKRNDKVPFVAMGYLNPIMQMGRENFFRKASECGFDGVIIPDLPLDTYLKEYKEISDRYNIPVIMLITPETSIERIRLIDKHCEGFIYMVSAAATTGARDSFGPSQLEYFKKISELNLHHARLIGFGISNSRTYNDACRYSRGAIIGSKFIKLLEEESQPRLAVDKLLKLIGRK